MLVFVFVVAGFSFYTVFYMALEHFYYKVHCFLCKKVFMNLSFYFD